MPLGANRDPSETSTPWRLMPCHLNTVVWYFISGIFLNIEIHQQTSYVL